MRAFGKFLGRVLLTLLLLSAAVWFLGPREPVDLEISFDPESLGGDLDRYLAGREQQFSDITPGVEKRIVWAGAVGQKTPWALVYLHGFSASSEEVRPVPDRVAAELGANLFFTRLTGHGRDGAALAGARAGDWIEDLAEALAIGHRLGDRVALIATSTGGTLAAIGVNHPDLSDQINGVVFLSPNFALQSRAAFLLELPMARWWVPLIAGSERAFEPRNEAHGHFWTHRYPTVALMPMAALVRHARELDYTGVGTPSLFIYAREDNVVSAEATADIARQWAGPMQEMIVEMGPDDDPNAHVIAGDIQSPGQTAAVVARIVDWISALDGVPR